MLLLRRVNVDWSYGLPELGKNYREKIANSKRIQFPVLFNGANVIIKPLLEYKILSNDTPFIINAISGYSGGGKSLINYFKKKSRTFFYTL